MTHSFWARGDEQLALNERTGAVQLQRVARELEEGLGGGLTTADACVFAERQGCTVVLHTLGIERFYAYPDGAWRWL